MNEDIRITLKRKGFIRQPDGSYSKAAPVAASISPAEPEPHTLSALDESQGDEIGVLGKARVRITRFSTGHLDRDNLYASIKSLLDGLQKAGLIRGDSDSDIDLEVRQQKVAKRCQQGTEILITEELE